MTTAWLRIAYTCEFLLATLASFTMWSQVGGQGHLDLMPWYWKLIPVVGISGSIVGFTSATAASERAITRKSAVWALTIILFGVAMGLITYYYHVNEPLDEQDDEGTTAALMLRTDS